MKQVIHVEEDIQKLVGVGEEWLVGKSGEVIMVFINGNWNNNNSHSNNETLTL